MPKNNKYYNAKAEANASCELDLGPNYQLFGNINKKRRKIAANISLNLHPLLWFCLHFI